MSGAQAHAADIDVGLREYMLRIYNYMASGLALTGIIAYASANTPAILNMLYVIGPNGVAQPTMLAWIAMLSPLGFILALTFGINKMKASTAQAVFWAFAAVMGLSLSHIFLTFTGASIARVFFITSGTFAAMSLYGYTTKKDLTGMGSFLFMGLIGIIIASIVNMFLQSTAMHFVISVLGVLIFVGLTAYDTQKIKNMYSEVDGSETASKKAIMGALTLYLDFINLFLMLLRLFGDRR
ncbi:MAG: Bax inhibitor-1/YccA family protein [Rhodospirillales bacterium]|nr:Bax inhibitor-1/YccA family protein [Alphaproteobacteria bacterium]MBL6948621.1 Bax inhibitor-1/YccA family protein [Rhodospirillales bacterium]